MWRLAGRWQGRGGGDGAALEFGREQLDDEEDQAELTSTLAWLHAHGPFFDPNRPLVLARAPGRLDVMGGIADYSGALALEYPLRAATWVIAQAAAPANEAAARRPRSQEDTEPRLVIESAVPAQQPVPGPRSDGAAAPLARNRVSIPVPLLTPSSGALDFGQARRLLTADSSRAWAAYVAGAAVVLHARHGARLPDGAKFLIRSDVPLSIGLSSSAALEVASISALAALTGTILPARDLALLAQQVENFVVGAPCGVMDQLTVAAGRKDSLLQILCQPAEVLGHIHLPAGLGVWGISSGIRHQVSGADYATVRTATFMGYRMIAALAGGQSAGEAAGCRPSDGDVTGEHAPFHGYLANVTPALWRRTFRDAIPERLQGVDFLASHGRSPDRATTVDPGRTYHVRACTEHPILEHDRIQRFRDVLLGGAGLESHRVALGELMYASHSSYSACGLGSDGTDALVTLARDIGPAGGVYGAKITGGGSGGTVAVLARSDSGPAIQAIAARYHAETGRTPQVVSGSSAGACVFGARQLVPVG